MSVLLLGCVAACVDRPDAAWLSESVSAPRVFAPGVISSTQREYGITFTPDGREAYFTRRPRRGPAQILMSTFTDSAQWSDPHPVDFAGERGEAPFVTPDGSRLLFASRRPLPGNGDASDNLWFVTRTGDAWSEPSPLPGAVNRPRSEVDDMILGLESWPTLLPDGTLLYTTRADADFGLDIYAADPTDSGAFLPGRPLRLNSVGDETSPVLTPDGRHLLFQGYRDAQALGDQDLYVARRTEYGWDTPVPLPAPFNSPQNDGYPAFSPDGRLFFFASDRNAPGGYYDIWYVETTELDLDGLTN